MNPTNCIKVINSGKLPEYLIYEHDSKLLIYIISEKNMMLPSDPQYSMYQTLPYKVIDGREINTTVSIKRCEDLK